MDQWESYLVWFPPACYFFLAWSLKITHHHNTTHICRSTRADFFFVSWRKRYGVTSTTLESKKKCRSRHRKKTSRLGEFSKHFFHVTHCSVLFTVQQTSKALQAFVLRLLSMWALAGWRRRKFIVLFGKNGVGKNCWYSNACWFILLLFSDHKDWFVFTIYFMC